MRLTWKDGVATLLAIGTSLVTLAVVQEWGWPLLGSYRAGAAVLLLMGIVMCALGDSTAERSNMRSPYIATMSVLGIVAVGLGIWALIADAEVAFLGLAVVTLTMWLASTLHHAVGARHVALGAP
jgi:hypothetical protein